MPYRESSGKGCIISDSGYGMQSKVREGKFDFLEGIYSPKGYRDCET